MKGIIITGLTGSGKTKVAFELAKKINGEVINLDRTFTWKYFPLSSGMSDIHEIQGIKKHLYEFLEPDEELISIDKFADMVIDVAKEIISRGKIPIVEGGSPKYFKGLYFKNKDEGVFDTLIYLTYPETTNIRIKILERINRVMEIGLIDEIRTNLLKYRDTQFMKEGKFVVPIVDYLDGKISLEIAKEKMVDGVVDLIEYQKEEFSQYGDLVLLENKNLNESLNSIVKTSNI